MTITFAFVASVSNEKRDANAEVNKKLGLPVHRGSGRLAVVGGGPSINDHIEELKNFDGTIWAVNGTVNWCMDHGIDAWFYTIDAAPMDRWTYDLSRITKAVLAIDCDPGLFESLKDARVETLSNADTGPTSANAADNFSIEAGYHGGVTFYGCESSFGESTHAYKSHPIDGVIGVKVGGKEYVTKPEFLEQARIMAEVIRTVPTFFREQSGGLLSAMVEHGMEYELVWISKAIEKVLREKNVA